WSGSWLLFRGECQDVDLLLAEVPDLNPLSCSCSLATSLRQEISPTLDEPAEELEPGEDRFFSPGVRQRDTKQGNITCHSIGGAREASTPMVRKMIPDQRPMRFSLRSKRTPEEEAEKASGAK